MEVQRIPDAGGNTLKVCTYKGRMFPMFPPEAIRGSETLNARADDVLVCAYPKSGTHWIWEVVRILLSGTTDIPVVEKDVGMIEAILPEELEKLSSPRALNTHMAFDAMPPACINKRCKLVYITRDPRDVAVSYFHHHKKLTEYYEYNGHWPDYLPLYMEGRVDYGSWFDYTKGWEQGIKENPELPIHTLSYENMHLDTAGEVTRLANFLGVEVTNQFVQQVVQKAHFDTMKNTKGKAERFNNNEPVMYRKGKTGDWKNNFTVAQSEQFDSLLEKEMADTDAHKLYSRETA